MLTTVCDSGPEGCYISCRSRRVSTKFQAFDRWREESIQATPLRISKRKELGICLLQTRNQLKQIELQYDSGVAQLITIRSLDYL